MVSVKDDFNLIDCKPVVRFEIVSIDDLHGDGLRLSTLAMFNSNAFGEHLLEGSINSNKFGFFTHPLTEGSLSILKYGCWSVRIDASKSCIKATPKNHVLGFCAFLSRATRAYIGSKCGLIAEFFEPSHCEFFQVMFVHYYHTDLLFPIVFIIL